MNDAAQKDIIRKNINEKRKKLDPFNKNKFDRKIFEVLLQLPEWKNAKNILMYVSHSYEVDTHMLIRTHLDEKNIVVPKTHKIDNTLILHKISTFNELKKGNFKILEPVSHTKKIDPKDIDLAVIPGVAFDLKGQRVGYGKAYYDNLIPNLNCRKIGLAYSFQIVDNVPAEKHDQPVDLLITEDQTHIF
ncbi:5-formyltetrahydrofolate cyclo-ligase [Patescibacteria group bacterium]